MAGNTPKRPRVVTGAHRKSKQEGNKRAAARAQPNRALRPEMAERRQLEASLRESEQRYRSVVAAMAEGVVIQDQDGRIRSCNASACRVLGLTEDQVLGRTSLDPQWRTIHEDGSPFPGETHPAMVTLRTGCVSENVVMGVHRPDGSLVWISINTQPIMEGEGEQPSGVVSSFRDITTQKQAEEHSRQSEAFVTSVLEHLPHMVFVKEASDLRFVRFNRAGEALLGKVRSELLGKTDYDFFPKREAEFFTTKDREVLANGGLMDIPEETIQTAAGPRILHTKKLPIFGIDGTPQYLLGISEDITEQKRAEESLQRTQFAMDQAVDAVYWIDPQARILYTNNAASEMLGYTADEFRRMTVHDLNPDFPKEMWPGFWEETRGTIALSFESVHLTKDGRRIPIDIRVSFLAYGGQEFHCAYVRDVSERKRAEAALQQVHDGLEQRVVERTAQLAQAIRLLQEEIAERQRVEARLRTTQYAVDHAADQIFVIGPDGFFLDVNESACHRLGYTKEELLRMSVMDLDPDFPPAAWGECWARLTRAGQLRLETRHRTKSGEIYPVEVVANYLCHDGQELDYAVVRDITDRRQAETALRESELRYKLLTEATFDGIAIHDQGIMLEVNAGLERMFGYESGELVGRSIFNLIADESRDLVLANMANGVTGPYEAMGCRKNGITFPGEVVVRPYRYRGKEVRLVAGRDITERKHLEAERLRHTEELERQVVERTAQIAKLESQRAQSERLAALGRLAAGVAHEINNPIAGIKNAFTLVKQAIDPAHAQYEFVDLIDREIARVSSIVQNMYQLYRRESGKAETVDLRAMIGDIKALFAKQLQQRQLRLVVEAAPGVHRLDVPRSDLLQVLLNLLNNAIDCSREGTTITLNILEKAEVIQIALADQGAGISPEVLPHIFDPFFTTKTEGVQKGMGLGLSVSQSLVAAMGGRIDVHTELGQGSTFSILLPRQTGVADARGQTRTTKEVMTHGC
ncbi:MAG: PAS domain S-box protein [Nitrospira sp.]|nr:MAG: PAS domain S-box protein [Nitrospira sp.]